jgi:hypothetical protein
MSSKPLTTSGEVIFVLLMCGCGCRCGKGEGAISPGFGQIVYSYRQKEHWVAVVVANADVTAECSRFGGDVGGKALRWPS